MSEAIIVHKIQAFKVDGHGAVIKNIKPIETVFCGIDEPVEPIEYETEYVDGKEFINANGNRVIIGLSKEVQSVIGLPFEVFENMNKQINELRQEVNVNEEAIKNLYQHIQEEEKKHIENNEMYFYAWKYMHFGIMKIIWIRMKAFFRVV